ncbi:FAD-binding protein [Chloroflexota bacterium]
MSKLSLESEKDKIRRRNVELQTPLPEKWHRQTDVVVVGYGAAGAATAITAHDAGAGVLILEKAPEGQEGGNSRVAGQGYLNPASIDKTITYFNALCGSYTVPEEMVRVWAEEMGRNNDWVRILGGDPVEHQQQSEGIEFPELPGADCVHKYHHGPVAGYEGTWNLFKGAVEERHIEVLYATPGKELIQNRATGEILGVRAVREGNPFNVAAMRAVVLTCGGFENNQEMIRDFLSDLPYCYPSGTPYNTGDGVKMAMTVGADLWHMNNISGPWYALKVPEFPSTFEMTPLHYRIDLPGGMIVVGANGKRFVDEKHRSAHGKVNSSGQWTQSPTPCPMFMIFDHTLFSAGPLHDMNTHHSWNPILRVYDWSDDNSAELAKGWIKKADTIAALAREIGQGPATLEDTINKWNGYCNAGKDLEFGRARMLSPIKDAPFYAVELSPTFINTQGGPRRNAKSQIVRPDGSPIGRLYSAGELGSIYGYLYQGTGNIGECMAFGRISGRNAAAEKPWR